MKTKKKKYLVEGEFFFCSNGYVSYGESTLQLLRSCGPERNVEECYGRFDHLLSVIVIYLFIR